MCRTCQLVSSGGAWSLPGLQSELQAGALELPRAMGSGGMFDEDLCLKCGGNQPKVYPDTHCVECLARARRELVRLCLERAFDDAVWEVLQQNLWTFLWTEVPFHRHRERLHYLRCALLARESPFRRFTYFHGGIAGSISQTEDIADRILSFLNVAFL